MIVNLARVGIYPSHPDSHNVDYASSSTVRRAYLLGRLPFDDAITDLSYSSHLLEHILRRQLACFLQELCRMLQPCGVLRLVVLDLENLWGSYLHHLAEAPVIFGAPPTSAWGVRHG